MRILSGYLLRALLGLGCVAMLVCPAEGRALGPGADIYLGYSRLGANTFNANTPALNGWEAAAHLHLLPFFGAEADVAHYGLGASASVPHPTTVLAGPRFTVGAAGIHVFVHGLAGWETSSTSGTQLTPNSGSGLAVAAGGGLDFRIFPFFAWRINGDYITSPTQSPANSSHERFGTGLVFRF